MYTDLKIPGLIERRTKSYGRIVRTIRMPHLPQEPHTRRRKRVIFWKLEFGREDSAFERRAFGTLDEGLPVEEVVFGDGTGGDAVRGIVGEGAVFLEETALGC